MVIFSHTVVLFKLQENNNNYYYNNTVIEILTKLIWKT